MQRNPSSTIALGYRNLSPKRLSQLIRASVLSLSVCLLLANPSASQESPICITIIGDSLAQGSQVVELQGTGYATIQTTPFSQVLTAVFAANAYDDIEVFDFSLPATALIAPNSSAYPSSSEFRAAQESLCPFTIIFPWLNDLAEVNQQLSFSAYSIALNELLHQLNAANPQSHLLLLSYYHAPLTNVGLLTYETSPSDEIIAGMNRIHQQYCDHSAAISCLNLVEILKPIEEFVSLSIPLNEFEAYGYRALDAVGQENLDAYFRTYPNGMAIGDGIHLNPLGKEAVAQAILQSLEDIDPFFTCRC